jgi:hypothetical protein
MQKYRKAIVAGLTAILVGWSTYAPASYNHWLPLVIGVLGALGVYGVSNVTPPTV